MGALQYGGAVTPSAHTRQALMQGLVLVLKNDLEIPITPALIEDRRSFILKANFSLQPADFHPFYGMPP